MSFKDKLKSEINREFDSTQKILNQIPEEKFDWKPHKKSMTLKGLGTHIAQLQGMTGNVLNCDNFVDLAEGATPEINHTKDLLNLSEECHNNTLEAIDNADEEELEKAFELRYQDKVLMSMPKGKFIRKMGLSHIYHHRGQLSVYLRLLDQAVPGMYGRSADEK